MANKYAGREKEYLREWHKANPGKQTEYLRRYKEKHGEEKIKASRKQWNEKNPEARKEARNAWRQDKRKALCSHYRDKFKKPLEFFEKMLSRQGGACAICEMPLFFGVGRRRHDCAHVDHCHTTGKVRGVLCRSCNQRLGVYEKDPGFPEKAQKYLDTR